MRFTRREFMKVSLLAGMAGSGLGSGLLFPKRAYAFAQSPTIIHKFSIHLPGLTPAGQNELGNYIPVATPVTKNFMGQLTDHYYLTVKQYTQLVHPDLPGSTHCWGY